LLLQLLYDTIKLCLVKATAAGMTSAAFPTVGCGRLGYDPRDVADCFLRAQRDTGCQLRVCIKETLTTQRSHFPCGRLSWLPVSFLLHVKHTISYRIVSYRIVFLPTLIMSQWTTTAEKADGLFRYLLTRRFCLFTKALVIKTFYPQLNCEFW